jgi:selenocysteine lyase/cysteine desulfurase
MVKDGFEDDFPLLKSVTHLASASRGPIPRAALDEMQEVSRLYGSPDEAAMERCETSSNKCRYLASRLLNCKVEEIALVFNTTHGINSIATGIDWHRGDVVVLPDIEYPANVVPWLRQRARGVKVRAIRSIDGVIDLDSLRRIVDDDTRVVAISHVEFANGFKNDLMEISEIAHRHGAMLFVDSAQSLGIVDTDVRKMGVDSLSACGYKWLCSPPGSGILFVREDLIPEILPAYSGFESVDPGLFARMFDDIQNDDWTAEMNYPLSRSANRFEFGESNLIPNVAFARSLEYLQEIGIKRIERDSKNLVEYLISRLDETGYQVLTPLDPSRRAGIVTFRVAEDESIHREVAMELRRRGILVSPRYGGLRACCHFFNDREDVEVLLDNLRDIIGRRRSDRDNQ